GRELSGGGGFGIGPDPSSPSAVSQDESTRRSSGTWRPGPASRPIPVQFFRDSMGGLCAATAGFESGGPEACARSPIIDYHAARRSFELCCPSTRDRTTAGRRPSRRELTGRRPCPI